MLGPSRRPSPFTFLDFASRYYSFLPRPESFPNYAPFLSTEMTKLWNKAELRTESQAPRKISNSELCFGPIDGQRMRQEGNLFRTTSFALRDFMSPRCPEGESPVPPPGARVRGGVCHRHTPEVPFLSTGVSSDFISELLVSKDSIYPREHFLNNHCKADLLSFSFLNC